MNDNDNDETRPIEAVRALRDRGIDNAEDLLQYGTPDQILAACHRWDGRRNAGPGLLARMIRDREFPDEGPPPGAKAAQLRARFDDYAQRFPEGAVAEPHWVVGPTALHCPGHMIVIEATYPNITVECDKCGFEAAYPVRSLHVLAPAIREAPTREETPF